MKEKSRNNFKEEPTLSNKNINKGSPSDPKVVKTPDRFYPHTERKSIDNNIIDDSSIPNNRNSISDTSTIQISGNGPIKGATLEGKGAVVDTGGNIKESIWSKIAKIFR